MSVELYRERPFIKVFWLSPLILCHIRQFSAYIVSFVDTDQWTSPKHHMKGNSSLIGRKNLAKFENDWVSRNGHRIKLTQPNSMIGVSFSSAEDALFKDVKKNKKLLDRRVLKIRRSAFFGTPDMVYTTFSAYRYFHKFGLG